MNEHAEFDLLDEFVLGTLDAADAVRVGEHIQSCDACRAEYDELRVLIDLLPQALSQQPPPPALRDRIFAAIDAPVAVDGPSTGDGSTAIDGRWGSDPSFPIGGAGSTGASHTMAAPHPTAASRSIGATRPIEPSGTVEPPVTRDDGVAPLRSGGAATLWRTGLVRGLAAALLVAVAGDALLAIRLGRPGTQMAIVTPSAAPTTIAVPTAPASMPRTHARTPLPARRPAALVSPTPATRDDARTNAAIAKLARDLAVARSHAGADRRRISQLETALALARATPRIVTVTRPAVTVPAATPPAATPIATPAPAAEERLVAALRTGRVYAIDGAVDGEPWHLTIVQSRDGERALLYSGTPDAPSGETYRTWVLRSGRTVDVGELSPGKPTTLEMPMALEPGDVVAFSREPIGATGAPTSPFLMQLKITQ